MGQIRGIAPTLPALCRLLSSMSPVRRNFPPLQEPGIALFGAVSSSCMAASRHRNSREACAVSLQHPQGRVWWGGTGL